MQARMDTQQQRWDSRGLLDVMAVGNPTLQRALAESEQLGMSQPDRSEERLRPNPSANYFDDDDGIFPLSFFVLLDFQSNEFSVLKKKELRRPKGKGEEQLEQKRRLWSERRDGKEPIPDQPINKRDQPLLQKWPPA
ncbi:hypothetical protein Bca52824_063237 [Brassica carinata]|uniref:Uncharacterized protein n=1 Tax=Brassica carinata TaxID=52824 RepID=A0A8X7U7I2_BRACI|nr:hypothetical protein Bca52824_063237 [Brassica carinata]